MGPRLQTPEKNPTGNKIGISAKFAIYYLVISREITGQPIKLVVTSVNITMRNTGIVENLKFSVLYDHLEPYEHTWIQNNSLINNRKPFCVCK